MAEARQGLERESLVWGQEGHRCHSKAWSTEDEGQVLHE